MLEYDRLFLGNRWVTPATESVLDVRSPATLALVGRSPDGSPDDMDRAVAAARDAFDTGPWPTMSFAERAAYLDRILEALVPRAAELDDLVPQESGIPVCFASGSSGFPLLEYYSELGRTHPQEELRPGRPGVAGGAIVRQAPAGVVAGIVPWNGPVMQILMKMAPALVAGCTLVIKPSPETPLSSYAIARAVEESDLPPGVISIVPGGREAGAHLVCASCGRPRLVHRQHRGGEADRGCLCSRRQAREPRAGRQVGRDPPRRSRPRSSDPHGGERGHVLQR